MLAASTRADHPIVRMSTPRLLAARSSEGRDRLTPRSGCSGLSVRCARGARHLDEVPPAIPAPSSAFCLRRDDGDELPWREPGARVLAQKRNLRGAKLAVVTATGRHRKILPVEDSLMGRHPVDVSQPAGRPRRMTSDRSSIPPRVVAKRLDLSTVPRTRTEGKRPQSPPTDLATPFSTCPRDDSPSAGATHRDGDDDGPQGLPVRGRSG